MRRRSSSLIAAAAVAGVLGLAGCGSGSGQSVPKDPKGELTASVGWADWRGEDPSEFKLRVERSLRQAREAGGDVVRPATA